MCIHQQYLVRELLHGIEVLLAQALRQLLQRGRVLLVHTWRGGDGRRQRSADMMMARERDAATQGERWGGQVHVCRVAAQHP